MSETLTLPITADAFLNQADPNGPAGATDELLVGGISTGPKAQRSLVQADLTKVPSGAPVSGATLRVYKWDQLGSRNLTIFVYRLKRAWVEAQATWNQSATGVDWTSPGAFHSDDCEQSPIGSRAFTSGEEAGYKDFSLTAASKTDLGDYGYLLKGSEEGGSGDNVWYFRARENSGTSQDPLLIVTFTGDYYVPTVSDISLPAQTGAAAGTFTAPLYTASAGLLLGDLDLNAVGTAPPVYFGTSARALGHCRIAAAGSHAVPVYTAAALVVALPAVDPGMAGVYADAMAWPAFELPGQLVAAAGTAVAPVYTGAGAVALGRVSAVADGAAADPFYTGSLWKVFGAMTAAAEGEALHDTGILAAVLGPVSWTATAAYAAPVYSGTLPGDLGPLTAALAGIHDPTVAEGEAALTLPGALAAAAGVFTAFAWATTAALTVAAAATAAEGTFTAPVYEGAGVWELGGLGESAAGTFSAPVYSGAQASLLGPLAFASEGLAETPIYSGVLERTLSGAILAALGGTLDPVTGVAEVWLPNLLAALVGDYEGIETPGDYTGAAQIVLPNLLAALVGDYEGIETPGDYTGAAQIVLADLGLAAAGVYLDYVPPPATCTGESALSLSCCQLFLAGSFAAPVYSGTVDVGLAMLDFAAVGTFAAPVYAAAIDAGLPALGLAAVGPYVAPNTGAAALICPAIRVSVAGTATAPVYTGESAVFLVLCQFSAAGSFAVPVYGGTLAVDLGPLTAGLAALATMRAIWPMRASHRHVAQPGSTARHVVQPAARRKRIYQPHAKLVAVQTTPDLGA